MITFSWALIRAVRDQERLEEPFIKLALGVLLLSSYEPIFTGLDRMSQELVVYLERLGDKTALIDFISQSMVRAGSLHQAPAGSGVAGQVYAGAGNIAEYLSQALRTGVWGICASVVEFLFLIVRYLLSIGREVLWELILVFMPLMIGLLPATHRLGTAMALCAVELSLWQPVLTVIDIVTSRVARARTLQSGDLGLTVVAVELLAVVLALAIVPLCHQLISGSLKFGVADQLPFLAKLPKVLSRI
jgi:hypothetical protein